MISCRVASSALARRYELIRTGTGARKNSCINFTGRRHYSSSAKSSSESSSESLPDVTSSKLINGSIVRHGAGDGVIILNVGGKEFKTLRSTVASNRVLSEHVARAEANHELVTGTGPIAVFIDRDPTFFHIVLAHLRNKCDGVSLKNAWAAHSQIGTFTKQLSLNSKNVLVQLPRETEKLSDILLEAHHYRIKELADAACRENWMLYLSRFFGGRNPFQTVNAFVVTARRFAVALAGSGGIFVAVQQDWEWFQKLYKKKGVKAIEDIISGSGKTAGLEVKGKDGQLKIEPDQ